MLITHTYSEIVRHMVLASDDYDRIEEGFGIIGFKLENN